MLIKKPMLVCKVAQMNQLRYPLYAQPNIKGVRCILQNQTAFYLDMKRIPNLYIQSILGKPHLPDIAFDGIISCKKHPTLKGNIYDTQDDTEFEFRYLIFDCIIADTINNKFSARQINLVEVAANYSKELPEHFCILFGLVINNEIELGKYYTSLVDEVEDFNGLLLHSLDGPYKQGTCTFSEQFFMRIPKS